VPDLYLSQTSHSLELQPSEEHPNTEKKNNKTTEHFLVNLGR
jgi:hypothetical protein